MPPLPGRIVDALLNAMHCGKKWWIREFVAPYIFPLNPDYAAARSLRSLRSKKAPIFAFFGGSNFPLLDTMLKICWILLCIENEQRSYINRTHDETYLSRNYVCFGNSIDSFGQAIFWAGFKEARTYIYACWLTLVMFLNLHCCGSIVQYWELCISCLPILTVHVGYHFSNLKEVFLKDLKNVLDWL